MLSALGLAKLHAEDRRNQIQMECSCQPPVQGADDDQGGCDYVNFFILNLPISMATFDHSLI